jgi:hypothetical protein
MAVRALTRQELKDMEFEPIFGEIASGGRYRLPAANSGNLVGATLKTFTGQGVRYSKTLFGTLYTDGTLVYFSKQKHDLMIRDVPEFGRQSALALAQ